MPRPQRKTNQVSAWFNGVLRETRQGDILEDVTAIATLDTVESFTLGYHLVRLVNK